MCKLGMLKAFEMAFRVSVRKKGMSSCGLAKGFACQQRSAWLWKAKIQEAMQSSGQHKLETKVEVDEFLVGRFFRRATRQKPWQQGFGCACFRNSNR